MYMDGYSMGFGSIFMVIIWVLLAFGIIALFKFIFNQNKDDSKQDDALEILKKRYAKGEIDHAEYQTMKHNLSND